MRTSTTATILLLSIAGTAWADNWPQWRGPLGTGISPETGVPVRWSNEAVSWKAALGGLGVSSPIVWEDRILVTSQTGRAALRPGNHPTLARGEEAAAERSLGGADRPDGAAEEILFLVEAFHRSDGRRLWRHQIAARGELPPLHKKNNLASPSPVTDGDMVFAWFGNGQLAALTLEGRPVWQRHLGSEYSPFDIAWGHGSSPLLYRDLVILLCDHNSASYLLALDKKTGKERWKIDRAKGSTSYSTPAVIRGPGGMEVIVNSSERIDAYDPATGRHLWHTGESNRFPIPVPTFHDGVLYMSRGYRSGPYMAIRSGGRGDITRTHVEWLVPTGAPYVSSLLYYQGLIYMANDVGVATCVDASTGARIWQERIEGIFSASPVAADGKVYLVSETGETYVLQAGREFKVLARNSIGERLLASPAISGAQIFLRADGSLYCIGPGN